MRAALNVLLGTALVFVVSGVRAEEKKDKKEVTLKGTIVCTKCELDETKACGNAIKTQIDGKDVVAMSGNTAPDVTETLSFDPASGLLLRRQIVTHTPVGNLTEEVDYSDYRDVGGVKLPFQIKRLSWEVRDVLTVSDAKPNAAIDDARFSKPKS